MFPSYHIKHTSYKSVKSYYTKHIGGGGTNFPSESIYTDRDSVGGAEGRRDSPLDENLFVFPRHLIFICTSSAISSFSTFSFNFLQFSSVFPYTLLKTVYSIHYICPKDLNLYILDIYYSHI